MVTNLYIFIPAKFLKKLKKVSAKILYIKYICIYVSDSQIVHHNPCFNLFILHDNSFDNQGSKTNKNDIFLCFDILHILTTTYSINLHLPVIAHVLEFARN